VKEGLQCVDWVGSVLFVVSTTSFLIVLTGDGSDILVQAGTHGSQSPPALQFFGRWWIGNATG
jgi:hypothetical protein